MNKLKLLLLVFISLVISGCASTTKYIEIQQSTRIWMEGKAIYTAKPGDILRVVGSKTCRSGKGTCWWVKNEKKGYGGIVRADEMKHLHRVYEVEQSAQQASSKPDCITAGYIEDVNKGEAALERIANIKSENAILYIALDPLWSVPEFQYEGYHGKHFIAGIKRMRKSLIDASIDEVVIWSFGGSKVGMAMPFKEGCGVELYGDLDKLEKLMLMHEAFLLISKHGLDDSSARDSIKKIIMVSKYADHFKDEMIDIMIDNLHPLMAKSSQSNE